MGWSVGPVWLKKLGCVNMKVDCLAGEKITQKNTRRVATS